MPRQLDKLNPHMDKEARRGVMKIDSTFSPEEWDDIMKQIRGAGIKNITSIKVGKVCHQYIFNHSRLSTIMGPVGSGKSTGSILKILLYALCIRKGKDGIRKSKWVVVRNTKPELKQTTIKTWMEWMHKLGRFNKDEMTFYMKFDDVEAEVLFLALDDAKDVGKLLSLEMTGIYFNELSQIDREIWEKAQTRIGRYPSLKATGTKAWWDLDQCKKYNINIDPEHIEEYDVKINGEKKTIQFYQMDCIFSDTNPPKIGSYYQKLFEKQLFNENGVNENPKDFKIYKQPSGMSPYAENKKNLKHGYYEDMVKNLPKEKVDVDVHVQYSLGDTGLGVYRDHFKEEHIKKFPREKINRNQRLLIGMDFGLTPACVIAQIGTDGKLRVFDEIYTKETAKMHLKDFMDIKVEPFLMQHYSQFMANKSNIMFLIDPAGLQRNQVNGETAIRELKDRGYFVRADSTNKLGERLQSVKDVFKKCKTVNDDKLEYQFEISDRCDFLIDGFRGNYYYEKSKTSFKDEPCKNMYSHIQDAFQYLCVHIEKYHTRYSSIDNNYNQLYNNRNVLDDKIGY